MAPTFDVNSLGTQVGGITMYAVYGVLVLVALFAGFFIIRYFLTKKNWNLNVWIKIPRANGLMMYERAKGRFDTRAGIVDIKRKKLKPVGMKPFDVREYLQGSTNMEVMMLSPTEFIPIIAKSYEIVENGGHKHIVANITTDLGKRKVWKDYFERSSKARFTLEGFMAKHQFAISIVIIMLGMFVGFAILYAKVKP
jgi:hypothetical protein